MSNLENDKIYENAYEGFWALYLTSDSFASKVEKLIPEYCDEYMSQEACLRSTFAALWDHDCELVCRSLPAAIEAVIMFHESRLA